MIKKAEVSHTSAGGETIYVSRGNTIRMVERGKGIEYFDRHEDDGTETVCTGGITEIPLDMVQDAEATVEDVRTLIDGMLLEGELTEAEIEAIHGLYDKWEADVLYPVGKLLSHLSVLYRVVQEHTSQAGWEPQVVPALFVKVAPPNTIPDWIQPTGGHDAYNIGDKVRHNSKIWESTVSNNVWEPGVYGWVEVSA